MSRALILCGLLGVCAVAQAEPPIWSAADEVLLHSARAWEAHDRDDLAQLALKKLVAARPDSPQGLLELGELDLRIPDYDDAKEVRDELNRRFGGTAASRSFALEYRIETHDRVVLASIRQLIELGRASEVRTMLDRLFPDGAPSDALGIEYYEMLASTPNGWARAYDGLRRLAARHTNDPRYQLGFVRQLLRHQQARTALALLQRWVGRDDVRADEVDELLEATLTELGYQHAPQQLVLAYLHRHPNDAAVLSISQAQEQTEEERQLLIPKAWDAIIPALQRRLSRDLSSSGLHTPEARQAEFWLERSRASMSARQKALAALQLRAALAFYHKQFEAQIAIARDLAAHGMPDEARELLAAAVEIDPSSSWLFESYARWLIEHERPDEALAMIGGRALGGRWTLQTRNALMASALDRRAAARGAHGDAAGAMEDWEAAVQLAPRDPWMRYRLALLYAQHDVGRARALMSEGVRIAPADEQMRYAQALILAGVGDDAAAIMALDAIPQTLRTAEMNELHDRMRVALACAEARRLKSAGDVQGARQALMTVESIGAKNIDRAAELAYAWIEIGDAVHAIALLEPICRDSHDPRVLLIWANVLNSAEDTERLGAALAELRALPQLDAAERTQLGRLQRALDLRQIHALERERRFGEAARRLDALLRLDPKDPVLRAERAGLYLATGEPKRARDLYAALVAEDPDDLDIRLGYIRALTESGDLAMARAQLHAVESKVPAGDGDLQLNLARRQLALGYPRSALRTLRQLLAMVPVRADVLLLAGRAEREQRHFEAARDLFARAERAASGDEAADARRELEDIEARLRSGMSAGVSFRHQPGESGTSQLDMLTIPSAWLVPLDYEHRLIVRADAVTLDAGRLSNDPGIAALVGTVQAAGPSGTERYTNGEQRGLSLGVGYKTDSMSLDLGTTPLGFLVSNVVGGIEWTPKWKSADVTIGLSRRAVTSSELSYAGLRDPITGTAWGGVVQSGPYASIGLYRERFGVSGSLQMDELTGTRVLDNRFLGARLASDWKFVAQPDFWADAGVTLNYWNYQHNLLNYTFGSGGYYSPQSYVSLAAPVEVNGTKARWNYRLRLSPSYTISESGQSAFYPDDSALQTEALHSTLPAGFTAPFFPASRLNAFGFSASAASERQISRGLVLGAAIDLDRTDYYHPTTIMLYFRHAFAPWSTPATLPVQPIHPYNP